MNNDYSSDPYVQTMIKNMPEKTGKSLDEWFTIIENEGLDQHNKIMALLKSKHNITHGYANTISLLFRQKKSGSTPSNEDLVFAQYVKKTELKPIYDFLISEVRGFGDDVEIAPKKSYVSLRRAKQFAIVQPSTKARLDLGLNLPSETESSGALIDGDKWSGMCSHRIEIHSLADVTPEVLNWLNTAYLSAG